MLHYIKVITQVLWYYMNGMTWNRQIHSDSCRQHRALWVAAASLHPARENYLPEGNFTSHAAVLLVFADRATVNEAH